MRKIEEIIDEIQNLCNTRNIPNAIMQELEEAGFIVSGIYDDMKDYSYIYKDTFVITIRIQTKSDIHGEYRIDIYSFKNAGYRKRSIYDIYNKPPIIWKEVKELTSLLLVKKEYFDECMKTLESIIHKIIFELNKSN